MVLVTKHNAKEQMEDKEQVSNKEQTMITMEIMMTAVLTIKIAPI